jgi:putative inorganic carbon (HCO3(-)) transporter
MAEGRIVPRSGWKVRTVERLAAAGLITGLGLYFLAPGEVSLAGLALSLAVALIYPPMALLAAIATLPLHWQTRSVGPLAFSSTELMLLAAGLGTVPRWITALRHRLSALPLQASAFDWPIALLLSSGLVSLLVTEYLRLSLRELRTLLLEPIMAYYLLLAWFHGRAAVQPLATLLVASVATAVAGLAGLPLGIGTSEAEDVRRLQVIYPSANHLGLFLGRALPWLIAFAWLGERWWRRPAVIGSLAIGAALFATFSLGAWLGSAAALLAIAAAARRPRLVALAALVLAAGGLAGLAFFPVERVWSHLEPGRGTTFFRLQLWQSAMAMLRDHPILGVGLDNFLYLYQQHYILPGALAESSLSHPHNLVLHFWLQLGLAGLAAALWLLVKAFALAHRLFFASRDRLTQAIAIGATGSLVDFVVHGLVDNSYFLLDLAIIFWLTLAVLETCRRHSQMSATRVGPGLDRSRPLLCSSLSMRNAPRGSSVR